jgi:hypothetical protein
MMLVKAANGWLFDRFAYFLFHDRRDNQAALTQAKRSTELLPNEGEVWFTRGIIESRLGMFRSCETSMQRAEALGVDKVRTAAQLCWAYMKARPTLLNLAEKQLDFLKSSLLSPQTDPRTASEVKALTSRLVVLREKGRFRQA